MTIFEAIKQHRAQARINKEREAINLAAEKLANAIGNTQYAVQMMSFYETELSGIDHTVDFWRYAELKQKFKDCSEEYNRYTDLVKERRAQLAALQNKEKAS